MVTRIVKYTAFCNSRSFLYCYGHNRNVIRVFFKLFEGRRFLFQFRSFHSIYPFLRLDHLLSLFSFSLVCVEAPWGSSRNWVQSSFGKLIRIIIFQLCKAVCLRIHDPWSQGHSKILRSFSFFIFYYFCMVQEYFSFSCFESVPASLLKCRMLNISLWFSSLGSKFQVCLAYLASIFSAHSKSGINRNSPKMLPRNFYFVYLFSHSYHTLCF